MTLTIRKMEPADSQHWAEMRLRMWDSLTLEGHLQDIAKMLDDCSNSCGYIAVLGDGLPVGFAEISIRQYANGCTAQPAPFLEGIWIEPQYQTRKFGRALVAQIEQDLLDQGYEELCSDADIDNTISHHAHGRWGFEETQRVVFFRKKLKADTPNRK